MTALRYGVVTQPHGYGRYTNGCRCDICRAAKAGYMAARRREARQNAADLSGEDFTHGTRYGYEERGCRCPACTEARRFNIRLWAREHRACGTGRCRTCGYTFPRCCCPAPLTGRPELAGVTP